MSRSILKTQLESQGYRFTSTHVTFPDGPTLPYQLERAGRKRNLYIAAREDVLSVAWHSGQNIQIAPRLNHIRALATTESPVLEMRQAQQKQIQQKLALITAVQELLAPLGLNARPIDPAHPGLFLVETLQGKKVTTLRHDPTNLTALDDRGQPFADIYAHESERNIDYFAPDQWVALVSHPEKRVRISPNSSIPEVA